MLCNHDSGLTLLKPKAMKGKVKLDLSQLYMLMNKRHATGCHTLADTHLATNACNKLHSSMR